MTAAPLELSIFLILLKMLQQSLWTLISENTAANNMIIAYLVGYLGWSIKLCKEIFKIFSRKPSGQELIDYIK